MSFEVAKYELDKLKKQISGVTKDLPLDVLESISRPLTDVQGSISKYSPEIEKSSQIRYFHKTKFLFPMIHFVFKYILFKYISILTFTIISK